MGNITIRNPPEEIIWVVLSIRVPFVDPQLSTAPLSKGPSKVLNA